MKKHLPLQLTALSGDLDKAGPESFYGILGEVTPGFFRTDAFFPEELAEHMKK